MTLSQRMFAIDASLTFDARNWNHNLASGVRLQERFADRPKKLARVMSAFDPADWLARGTDALAEIRALDADLATEIEALLNA